MLVIVGVGRAGHDLVEGLGGPAFATPDGGARRLPLGDRAVRPQGLVQLLGDAVAVVVVTNEVSAVASLVVHVAQALGALVLVTTPRLGEDALGEPGDPTPVELSFRVPGGAFTLPGLELFGVGPWPPWLRGGRLELVAGDAAADSDGDLADASAVHVQIVGPPAPFSRIAWRLSQRFSSLPVTAHATWSWWADTSPRPSVRVAALIERRKCPPEPTTARRGEVLGFPGAVDPVSTQPDRHAARIGVLARRCDHAFAALQRRTSDAGEVRPGAATDLAAAASLLSWELAARSRGAHRARAESVLNGVSALLELVDEPRDSFSARAQLAICERLDEDPLGRALVAWLSELDAPVLSDAAASSGPSHLGRGVTRGGAGGEPAPSTWLRRPLLALLHARPTAHRLAGPHLARGLADPLGGERERRRLKRVLWMLSRPHPDPPDEPGPPPGPSLWRKPVEPGEPVLRWADGGRVERLSTREQLRQEGESMGHCVGGILREGRATGGGRYWQDVLEGRAVVFSYRDARGVPRATFDVLLDRRLLRQLLGRTNAELDPSSIVTRRCQWVVSAMGLDRRRPVTLRDGTTRFVVPQRLRARQDKPWDELVAVTADVGLAFEALEEGPQTLRVAVGKEGAPLVWGTALGPPPAEGRRLELVWDGSAWSSPARPDLRDERPLDLLRLLGAVIDPEAHRRTLAHDAGGLDASFSTLADVLARPSGSPGSDEP